MVRLSFAGIARQALTAAVLSVCLAACSDETTLPVAPSSPATTSTSNAVLFTIAGTITDGATQSAVAGAKVEVIEGANAGRAVTTGADGRYALADLEPGALSVRATAEGFESETRKLSLTSSMTADLPLRRPGQPGPSGPTMSGTVVDALSNRAVPGATIRIDGIGQTTSTGDGTFSIVVTSPEQVRSVTASGPSSIDRVTRMRVPGTAAVLNLMPAAIDLAAFDQMFRGNDGVLHRWVSAPRLVIQRRALQFTNTNDAQYRATSAVMSDAEVSRLLADLNGALPQLTGGTFGGFAEQRIETAAEGEMVSVTRPGWIVVARYQGLTAANNYWGYTRWAWNGAGEVQAASVMFDCAFEASASPFERSLHAHELGHALGYNHVSLRPSVMNINGQTDVSAWDRDGARLAFMRPTLNQSPDIDPDPFTVNTMRSRGLTWSGAQ